MKKVDKSEITLTLDIISETAALLKARFENSSKPLKFNEAIDLLTDIHENWLEVMTHLAKIENSRTGPFPIKIK